MWFLRNTLCTMLIFQPIIQFLPTAIFCFNCFCVLPFSFPFSIPLFSNHPPWLATHSLFVSCIFFVFSDVTHFHFPDEFSQTVLILSHSSTSDTTLEANVFKCYPYCTLHELQIPHWQASNPAHFTKFQGQQLVNLFPLYLGQWQSFTVDKIRPWPTVSEHNCLDYLATFTSDGLLPSKETMSVIFNTKKAVDLKSQGFNGTMIFSVQLPGEYNVPYKGLEPGWSQTGRKAPVQCAAALPAGTAEGLFFPLATLRALGCFSSAHRHCCC